MSDTPAHLADVLAEARNKYTVHDCNECDYRKSCDLRFDCDECKTKRKSISLAFGIEDDYFTKLLDRVEAAAERKQASLENALSHCREYAEKIERENEEGETRLDAEEIIATVDNEFAGIRPALAPGNAAAMRGALENLVHRKCLVSGSCSKSIAEQCEHPSCVWYECRAALAAPARNCDVGTAEEQAERHERFCAAHYKADSVDAQCFGCPASDKKETDCEFVWGQLPFAPAKGGAE